MEMIGRVGVMCDVCIDGVVLLRISGVECIVVVVVVIVIVVITSVVD